MSKKFQPWVLKGKKYKVRQNRRPPFAPSIKEQKIYEKYIRKTKGNALILGVTPELRDLSLERGLKTFSVDLSKDMIKKYTKLMQHKNHPNDITIKKNWLDMKFENNFFDIAMGDASFINLTTKKQNKKLFSILNKIIAPKGYLILRQWVTPNINPMPINKLTKLYRKNKLSFDEFFIELRCLTFFDKLHNKKTFQYDVKKNFRLVIEEQKKGNLTKDEIEMLQPCFLPIVNSVYPAKEFIKMAESFGFKLVGIFQDKKYRFSEYVKMYAFQKK